MIEFEVYQKAVKRYVEIMGNSNSPLYKTVTNGDKTEYIFDMNYGVPRACVEFGICRRNFIPALIEAVEAGII